MTHSEWIGVVRRMEANWPHSTLPSSAIAKWFDDLRRLPVDQVTAAVETAYRDGEKFPPNGAQILGRISKLSRNEIDHGEAWMLARKASYMSGTDEKNFEWLRELSPAAAETVRRLCGGNVLTYNVDEVSTVRAQFREIYKAVVAEGRRDDTYAGLPSAGLRGLHPRGLTKLAPRKLLEGLDG